MIAIIFEVIPEPGRKQDDLGMAARALFAPIESERRSRSLFCRAF